MFRKASLALIRKMVHYSSEVLLKEVCDSETGHNLPTVLVEITATVLDQEVQYYDFMTLFHPPALRQAIRPDCISVIPVPFLRPFNLLSELRAHVHVE